MPKHQFHLQIDEWLEVHELPDAWSADRLRKVLTLADYDDEVSDADALEMTLMSLQDLGPREAAEVVLQTVFADAMKAGVRQNSVEDLEDDRPWEQFATVTMQAGIFDAVVLLQQAFPNRYGIPDAIRIRFSVTATDAETREWLGKAPSPALLLRLLASGMDDDAVLNRLFGSELASEQFPNADAILWRIRELQADAGQPARQYEVYSSWQWLGPLEDRKVWSGAGWPDATPS